MLPTLSLWAVFVMIYVYKYFVGKENIIKDNYKKERVISRETIIVNYAKLKLKYGEVKVIFLPREFLLHQQMKK